MSTYDFLNFTPQDTYKLIVDALNELEKEKKVPNQSTGVMAPLISTAPNFNNYFKEQQQEQAFFANDRKIKLLQKGRSADGGIDTYSTDNNASNTNFIKKSVQDYEKENSEKRFKSSQNISNYPPCVRNISSVQKFPDPDSTFGVFYYAQGLSNNIYKSLGFSQDFKYFDFDTGQSGDYICEPNSQIRFVTGLYANKYPNSSQLRSVSTYVTTVNVNIVEYNKETALIKVMAQKIDANKKSFKESIKIGYYLSHKNDFSKISDTKEYYRKLCLEDKYAFDLYYFIWIKSDQYYQALTAKVFSIAGTILSLIPQTKVFGNILTALGTILEKDLKVQSGEISVRQFAFEVSIFCLLIEAPFIKQQLENIDIGKNVSNKALNLFFNGNITQDGADFIKIFGIKIFRDDAKQVLWNVADKTITDLTNKVVTNITGISKEAIERKLSNAIFNPQEAKFATKLNTMITSNPNLFATTLKKINDNQNINQIENQLNKFKLQDLKQLKLLPTKELNKRSPGYDPNKRT